LLLTHAHTKIRCALRLACVIVGITQCDRFVPLMTV
jgi:hypothetical protein